MSANIKKYIYSFEYKCKKKIYILVVIIHKLFYCYIFFEIILVKTVTKTTIDIELKGIRIAATIGVR